MSYSHEPGQSAQIHSESVKRESAKNPILRFIDDSPFLAISLLFHVLIIALLAFFTVEKPGNVTRKIVLNVEDIEEREIKHQTLKKEQELPTTASTSMGGSGQGMAGEGHQGAASQASDVAINNLDILGLRSAIRGAGAGDLGGDNMGDSFSLAPGMGGERNMDEAVDQFAVITINSVSRGKTLVALLIDQSRSVIYGDLPRLIQRMDAYFDSIDKNLPSSLKKNGRWVVVQYGREPKFNCHPSNNLEYVKSALRNVSVDVSGQENVCAAIQSVLNRFEGQDYDNLLIASLTDESGDDTKDTKVLERTLTRLRRAHARFYVFGYEATFCAQKKFVTMKIDMELLRGEDRAAMRGFEGKTTWGWADGGPECPRPELWWGSNWWRWSYWGGSLNKISSGFGMYGLNRLVLGSGGIYFLIKSESDYDEQKLYAKYKPDICNRYDYKKRITNRRLRNHLKTIWSEIGHFYLRHYLHNPKEIQKQLSMSRHGRDYCATRIRTLKTALREYRAGEIHNADRWRAHAELTLAELYRLRFMLGQYHEALKAGWESSDKVIPEKHRGVMHHGKIPSDYVGPRQAKREYSEALQHIDLVIERHKDTPWETAAVRLKNHIYPWRFSIEKKPESQPSPPSLAF
ncbi:MAG: vWA domain-containing protein [Candidatus Brocadiia bacterium]